MKILLTTDLYVPAINGVVTSVVSLKAALEKLGHEVRVLTLSEVDYIDVEHDIYAVSSFNVNKVYPGARLKLLNGRPVLKEIIDWEPDLIHTQSEFSTFRMAKHIAHYLSIPIVHTYHTVYEDYTHYFSPSKKTGKKIVASLTKKILNEVEEVIAPTDKVYNLLKSYEVTQPITVIPSGIQLDKFRYRFDQEKLNEIRDSYNIPHDAFLLVSLGRLGKEKNIEELLFFLSLLKIDVRLLVVGGGPNQYKLMDYAKKIGLEDTVAFTGMIDPKQVPIYYQVGDVFVSASTSETQGLTYIEALASGLPALCRADDSIKDVIVDGKTGYQYHSFKEFESCLYTLYNDSETYQNIAKDAEDFALKYYSSDAFAKHVLEVYEKALESYSTRQVISFQ